MEGIEFEWDWLHRNVVILDASMLTLMLLLLVVWIGDQLVRSTIMLNDSAANSASVGLAYPAHLWSKRGSMFVTTSNKKKYRRCHSCPFSGPRQAQGIVDSAMSAASSMVKARLSGGKSSGGGRVSVLQFCFVLLYSLVKVTSTAKFDVLW